MAATGERPVAGQVPGPVAPGPDPLERELRRMAVLQRRAIVQRKRVARRPGPRPLDVRAL